MSAREQAQAVWQYMHTKTGQLRLLFELNLRGIDPADMTEDQFVELAMGLARATGEFNAQYRALLTRLNEIETADQDESRKFSDS